MLTDLSHSHMPHTALVYFTSLDDEIACNGQNVSQYLKTEITVRVVVMHSLHRKSGGKYGIGKEKGYLVIF